MKQQVNVTLKLSLWLDARMEEDDIVTYVRASLPKAFGEAITSMLNPVDILDIREEAKIFSIVDPNDITRRPWAVWQLAPESDPEQRNIITTADGEDEISAIVHKAADAHHIVRCVNVHERLVRSLTNCANLLADYDESPGEEGDAWREAIAAISEATGERLPQFSETTGIEEA